MTHLIANTRTRTGLTVAAELDDRQYPKGVKISDQLMIGQTRPRGLRLGSTNALTRWPSC